jgi:putative endonuclease
LRESTLATKETVGTTDNPGVHHVYVVRCADGTLYTGYALDPRARERAHNAGHGARYTSGRRPVTLVYSESFRSKSKALRREYELKQLSRSKKEALLLSVVPSR